MKLLVRQPHCGYLDTHLWLPKRNYAEMQLRSALTYEINRFKAPVEAWGEERDHYRVPRNFILPALYPRLSFPLYDSRVRTFPRVRIQSKVVLDFKRPDLTVQRDSCEALLRSYDGILCLRCGMGKTVTGLHSAIQLNVPILVVVSDLGLAEQWTEEILEFTNLRREDIGFIGDGEFTWRKPICIALVQTLAGRALKGTLPPELTRFFGVVLGDEVHLLGAPFFNAAIPPFHGRRWGLSATPTRSDEFDSLLKYTFGQIIYTYLEPELIPDVVFRYMETPLLIKDPAVHKAVTDKTGELHLQRLYGHLATVERRVADIAAEVKVAQKKGRQILVLTQSKVMVRALGAHFPNAGLVDGDVKDRKERLRRIRECNPVIAISQLGRQALNKPQLDALFVSEPFTDLGVLQQIMGRVLRLYEGKQHPLVVFYDEVFIDEIHKMCLKIRKLLSRWPKDQGGRIRFTNVGRKR